jgi:hypothetical protein
MFESWADVFASFQDGVDLPSILIARYRIIWYAYTQHYLCIHVRILYVYEYICLYFMGVYYI